MEKCVQCHIKKPRKAYKQGLSGVFAIIHIPTLPGMCRDRSHSQIQPGQNGIRLHAQHAVHLARHAEPAVVANAEHTPGTVGKLRSVDQDIIRDPAVLGKAALFHDLQTGHRIHDGIAFFLVRDDPVDDPVSQFPVHRQFFGTRERRMEIESDL